MKTGLATLLAFGLGASLTIPAEAATKTTAKATPASVAPVAPTSTAPVVVASEVAGFTTMNVAATSTAGKPQLSLDGIGLITHIAYQGVATSVSGKTLTDSAANWTENQFNPPSATTATASYYLELAEGPLAGATFDIVGTDAKHQRLTLAEDLPARAGKKPAFYIRPHWTIASLFGAANSAGFQAGDAGDSDLISIYDGKKYEQYYFSNVAAGATGSAAAIGNGWRKVGGGAADASLTAIFPDEGLAITRLATTPIDLLVLGVVRTSQTLIPVERGMNVIANVYQAPIILSKSNLHTGNPATGLRSGATAANADTVQIFNGAGYETYYYQSSVKNGVGWRSSTDPKTDASGTEIAVGSSIVIERRGASGFNWVVPAPTP
jgi:uncharacterized protein (TIGR02597 family)